MQLKEMVKYREESIAELARLAEKETWKYPLSESEWDYPVLYKYLTYTLRRAIYQEKLLCIIDSDGKPQHATFNTGLVTRFGEDIWANLYADKYNPDIWFLYNFLPSSNWKLDNFVEIPERVTYFEAESSDLVYDTNLSLDIQFSHIINDRAMRFPKQFQADLLTREDAFRKSVDEALEKVALDYTVAIPNFYWPSRDLDEPGALQFLLPLSLRDPQFTDLALCVERTTRGYRAATVLTLEMAYESARVVEKPRHRWLSTDLQII